MGPHLLGKRVSKLGSVEGAAGRLGELLIDRGPHQPSRHLPANKLELGQKG